MLSEAHESAEDSRRSVLFFIGGFVLFTLVSAGFESVVSDRKRGAKVAIVDSTSLR